MKRICITLIWLSAATNAPAESLITGVIADTDAQTIEMPSLPGAWQRRIEWMADEGSNVEEGDLIIRLDPGSLIADEENARTALEKSRFTAERSIDEKQLEVIDAEITLEQIASRLRIAKLDASIPVETIPRLDFERNQLTLEVYQQAFDRAQIELENQRAALKDTREKAALEIRQAEIQYERYSTALKATEIRADRSGFMIYGENPFTGRKIFAGDTLYGGLEMASVASRNDLQVRLWIHEADFLSISKGQTIRVVTDAQDIEPFTATVTWRSNQAVEKQDWSESGYFEAYAQPDDDLPVDVMPGMSVLAIPNVAEEG
ncbi:MAG: hypothetical protein AAGA84_04540 [Pseudomonadota bacterium]